MTIDQIDDISKWYRIKEDPWNYYTDEMIEGLVEEETKPKFKVGDRVITNKGYIGKFEGWVSDYQVRVLFPESGCNVVIHPKDLKLAEEEMSLDKAGQITDFEYDGLAYTLPEGYRFVDENGNVINATKIVLEKKKKEVTYPKTFRECCQVLGLNSEIEDSELLFYYPLKCGDYTTIRLPEMEKFEKFIKLYLCRNAYWKIAGEEMGLGKSWEPSGNEDCFVVSRSCGEVYLYSSAGDCEPFEFPTAKMRDTFYENFKELIEQCKKLL